MNARSFFQLFVCAVALLSPSLSSSMPKKGQSGAMPKPQITTTSLPQGTVGLAYSQALNATGGHTPYSWSVKSGNLPVGLTLTSDGTLAGSPMLSGSFTFMVAVKDSNGRTDSQGLTVAVLAPLGISTTALPSGMAGTAYSAAVQGTGGVTPYVWSIISGALPPGISLANTSGVISGAPSAAGMYTFNIQMSDANGRTTSTALTLMIAAALNVTAATLPSGTAGTPYDTSIPVVGGTPPYSWSMTSGQLPPGLSLAAAGVISGTPSASGTYSMGLQVTDAVGRSASSIVGMAIAAAICTSCGSNLAITTASLPAGTVNTAYTATLSASGGSTPYTWSVSSGQLPPGLVLANSGTISGTPTTAGAYNLGLTIADSAGHTLSQVYQVTIANSSAGGSLTIMNADLPNGTLGSAYAVTMSASGGTPPYTWSVASGSLPTGLTLNSSAGMISGTPSAVGWSDFFSMQVNDAAGNSTSLPYSVIVKPVLDEYGGIATQSCNATGAFHPQKIGNRWLLCSPAGHIYYFNAVGCSGCLPSDGMDSSTGQTNLINAISAAKYGNTSYTWGPQQNRRLASWGFNGIGQISAGALLPWATDPNWPGDQTQSVKMPALLTSWSYYCVYNLSGYAKGPCKDLTWGQISIPYRATMIDYFDENSWTWESNSIASNPTFQSQLNSPWTIGVLADDTDWMWGFGFGPDLPSNGGILSNLGYDVLITSPMQTFNANPNGRGTNNAQLYSDTTVYSKAGVASPAPFACDTATPCSLRDSLKLHYGTISALNTAWGSNYTSFDSTGVSSTEIIGAGDGTTKTFTYNLAHTPISPLSIKISVGGIAQGGDCPWWNSDCNIQTPNQGTIMGPAGTTILTGYQPWLSRISGSAASGYPDAAYQAVIVWHYASGSPYVSAVSRVVSEHIQDQQPSVTAPGPDPTGTATGYDVFMGCELYSGNPTFGCTAPGVNSTLTLQATNIPVNQDWSAPGSGLVAGAAPPSSPSSINYSTGALHVTFSTAPPSGTQVAISYVYHGWHSGGTGVMDEDGSNPWVGTNPYCLTPAPVGATTYQCNGTNYPLANANVNLGNDVEGWIAQFSAYYHKRYSQIIKSYNPNVAFLGADSEGTWGAPPRKEILEGAAPYVDILWPGVNLNQANTDFLAKWFGDKPYLANVNVAATVDSSLFRYPTTGNYFDHPSQEDRGRWILGQQQGALSTQGSSTLTYPWVGYVLWGEFDFWNERDSGGGWGIVSLNDNPYDGKSDCQAKRTDLWGYYTGGEEIIPSWQPNHAYGAVPSSQDAVQVPVNGAIYTFRAAASGNSGSASPSWPTTLGTSVVDGTVTWTNMGTKSSASCYGDVIDYIKQANSLWYTLVP